MITIFFSTGQGENHYTLSAVDTFRKNLNKFHKIDIKRRWTFYCFRWLIDKGYIRRKARYKNYDNCLIRQIPSMITFTLKGVVWLVSMGVSGAKKIHKSIMKYLKRQDNRWPLRSQFDDGSYRPEDPGERKRLNGLLGSVTKKISD